MKCLVRKPYALLIVLTVILSSRPARAHTAVQAPQSPMSLATLRLSYFSGHPSLADSLDPAIVQSGIDAGTIALTNANLVHILPNGQVAPDLATWNVSPNRLVYTFTIRGNARFSNGHPVTALDASYSIQRALAPSTRSPVGSVYLNLIRGAGAFNTGRARALVGIKILIGGWHDPTYERLVDDAETTRDQKTRAMLYIRAQHIALEQGAWISVTQHVDHQLIKPYVHGLIGSEAYGDLVPREYSWANVWMNKSRHT